MERKKLIVIAVLVVVIVVAVVIASRRTATDTKVGSDIARAANAAMTSMIDMKTLEVFTEPSSDWQGKYKPDASGHFKNPKTGEYTIVPTIKCASCGQLIPMPEVPPDQLPPPVTEKGPASKGAHQAYNLALAKARVKIMNEYICPRCGKPATKVIGQRPPEPGK